jgi:hypothetical protein
MVTLAYICFVLVASLLGIPLGALAHFARAHFTYFPEDLGLGEPLNSLTRDDYSFEKYVVGAKWDDNGFWDAESNRNLAYYVISGFVSPLILGVVFFGQRVEIVAVSCQGFKAMGLSPLLCT